jgi:hypothetical protein
MRARFRDAFDAEQVFIVRRPLRVNGEALPAGAEFPKTAVKLRRLRELFDQRVLAYPGETPHERARPVNPVRLRLPDAYWRAPPPEPPQAPAWDIAIPDRWQYLKWPHLLALAASLSSRPIRTKRDVFASITAEEKRRAKALADHEALVRAA